MLHVILLILRIIGIILLILLSTILVMLFAVLLIPIRYRILLEHGEEFNLDGVISWLLHILHARIIYRDGKPHICIRIFGFILYDNLRIRVPKKRIKRHKRLRKKRRTKDGMKIKSVELRKTESDPDQFRRMQETEDQEIKVSQEVNDNKETIISHEGNENNANLSRKGIRLSETNEVHGADEDSEYEREKQYFFEKLANRIRKIKNKILDFFRKMKESILRWFEKLVNFRKYSHLIIDFIRNEVNKEGFRYTFYSMKKLLKHILPTTLRSTLIFGTGDPSSTGQVLGVMGIFYSFYGDKVSITPDFENERLEGKHFARGRIRLITILIIVIKLMVDKRFKELRRNFTILKEAL